MSVIGGVLLFAAGVGLGGGVVFFNRWCVQRESDRLRRENEHLKDSAWRDRLEFEEDRSYREGYYDGSKHPLSDVEKFADLLQRRNIDYRLPKEDGTYARRTAPRATQAHTAR